MSETVKLLERTLNESVGGPCDFPEKIRIPTDATAMNVTKRVRGNQGEDLRFLKDIKKMLEHKLVKPEEIDEMLIKGLLTKRQSNYIFGIN